MGGQGGIDHSSSVRSTEPLRAALLALCCFVAGTWVQAKAELPDQVQPSGGNVGDVRRVVSRAADTFGDYLDRGHDWLYRHMQYFIEDFDTWFAERGVPPIVVPVSPLRIDFDG